MGEWAVNHDIKKKARKKHVDIVDTSDARPRGLWVLVRRYRITNMAKHKTQYDNSSVPPAAPELAHPWASAVAWAATATGVSRETGDNQELFLGVMIVRP